jgi:hypothetical protein
VEDGEVVWGVLRGFEDDPGPSALALRLMGGVHQLVLRGDAPELAAHYPSVGGVPHEPWPAFVATLRAHAEELRALTRRPVQTNEVARCAAVLGGFLEVARLTRLPLRLLEVGASAGLNLRFDHYRYELGVARWGPQDYPVLLRTRLSGRPPLAVRPSIASRTGCDTHPVDPRTGAGRITLQSYIWPDQLERLERLRAALSVAAEVEAPVVRAGAADWVERQLGADREDNATVVFHSIVMQYLDDGERERLARALGDSGGAARPDAPLAWLRMEPNGDRTDVLLTLWPAGDERVLARAGYHGDPVEWL